MDFYFEGVSDKELFALQAKTFAFIFPNHIKIWGMAAAEAMAAGLPVVVSDSTSVAEAMTDGENALFVRPGHPEEIAAKVKMLQAGGIPIYEPGLEELVKKNVADGRLSFTNSTAEGVQKSDVVFIAVPTPPQPDGSVDLSYIERVARDIAAAMTSYKIVVDKSTVPVKTGEKVTETIKRYCPAKVEFDVVSNPEFLREGFAVEDFMKPDRVVIGTQSAKAKKILGWGPKVPLYKGLKDTISYFRTKV